MGYQTVFRIPSHLLRKSGDTLFLNQGDVEGITECNLLYFLKESRYHILDDFPIRGDFDRRLISSRVDGPFESAQNIKTQEEYSESSSQPLELLVPKALMPVNFEKFTLVEYGTQTDEKTCRFLSSLCPIWIPEPEEETYIGKKALDYLVSIFSGKTEMQITNHSNMVTFQTSTDEYLVELLVGQEGLNRLIRMTLFGKGDLPMDDLFQESGIYELKQYFSFFKNVGIRDIQTHGLAYNLDLKGKSMAQIRGSPNIII